MPITDRGAYIPVEIGNLSMREICYEVSLHPSKSPQVRPTDCGGRAGETLQGKGRGNPIHAATGRSTCFCAIFPKLTYLMKDWDSLNTQLENLLTFNTVKTHE